jgi:uncharacterized cofD-like protein
MNQTSKRMTVLGGGTGTFTVLSGLKKHPLDLSAIVSMSDGGGSTGILRDEMGVLPPGDLRQCLVALSEADQELRDLFLYRFTNESLAGHNFGNLFLSALEKTVGDPIKAVEVAHRILRVKGHVIPVSSIASNLVATLEDGTELIGEHHIDERISKRSPIKKCELDPPVQANPEAIEAIKQSDAIVICPGDLYTSIIPVLLVDGIAQALSQTQATIIYVVNLVTKPGQTDRFDAKHHVRELSGYLKREPDVVIMNSATPSRALQERYESQGEHLVKGELDDAPYRVISAPLIADAIQEQSTNDRLTRSLLRHDPDRLALAILLAL